MAEELWKASAVELAAGIRDKRFSCVEVMTSVVERICAVNPTPGRVPAFNPSATAERGLAASVALTRIVSEA